MSDDGEIELAQHATVRELVARLERERDEARAAREDAWRLLGARIAALEAAARIVLAAVHRSNGTDGPEFWLALYALERLLAAPEATPPDDGRVP